MTTGRCEPTDTGLGLLTGGSAGELMAAVLSAVGGQLLRWAPTQVDHQPGRKTTVSYSAQVRWADGSVTGETLGASSGRLLDGLARLSDGDTEIGMWRFPFDPDLPALPAACDHERMRRLVESVGLDVGDGAVRLRVRAYRPRRRAVIEVAAPGGGRVFVKVVRPHRARGLHERHRLAGAAGAAVPASLGWADDGLVVLAGLPGRTLREMLVAEGLVADWVVQLDPESVIEVLDTLPDTLAAGERRRTWGQRAGHYAKVIAAAAPELDLRARAVAETVDHDAPEGPDLPVHGDLYESQLMMHDGRISGLLDIDSAGRGERLDDAGCLLAHLSVLAQLHPQRAAEINRLGARLERRFADALGRAALARRTAAVVLSLATGPHRVQEQQWRLKTERRIALAEQWLHYASAPTVGPPI
ncbi:MAG: aminoglycoside phosphotransferase family protein [Pseudonocardiales bacterium]